MAGEVSGIILVGAFGVVTALCVFLMPKLRRAGSDGKAPPPARDDGQPGRRGGLAALAGEGLRADGQ